MLNPNGGFTKFPNSLRSAPWRNKPNTVAVYFTLRMHANHLPTMWNKQPLAPGELCIGRKSLAAEVNLTESKVRTALDHLQEAGEITIKGTNQYSIISFTDKENWIVNGESSPNGNTGEPPAENQRITTVGEMDTVGDSKKDSHTRNNICAPTEDEVVSFFAEKGLDGDPVMFWLHYESIGWILSGSPISNWKAAAYKWCRNGVDDR